MNAQPPLGRAILRTMGALPIFDDSSPPEAALAVRPPFAKAVENVVGNIDSVLLAFKLMMEQPPGRERSGQRTSALCDEHLAEFASTAQWFRFLATDAFKAAVRELVPDKADAYATTMDRVVPWMETALASMRTWRDFVAAAEADVQHHGGSVDALLDNPVAFSLFAMPEERRRDLDRIVAESRMFKGPLDELAAAREGRHPSYKKHVA